MVIDWLSLCGLEKKPYQMVQNNQGLWNACQLRTSVLGNSRIIDLLKMFGERVHSFHQILWICDSFKMSEVLACKIVSSCNILAYLRLGHLFCLLRSWSLRRAGGWKWSWVHISQGGFEGSWPMENAHIPLCHLLYHLSCFHSASSNIEPSET